MYPEAKRQSVSGSAPGSRVRQSERSVLTTTAKFLPGDAAIRPDHWEHVGDRDDCRLHVLQPDDTTIALKYIYRDDAGQTRFVFPDREPTLESLSLERDMRSQPVPGLPVEEEWTFHSGHIGRKQVVTLKDWLYTQVPSAKLNRLLYGFQLHLDWSHWSSQLAKSRDDYPIVLIS